MVSTKLYLSTVTSDLTTQQLNQLQHAMIRKFVRPEYDLSRFAL